MTTVHTHDIIEWQQCERKFLLHNKRFGLGYEPKGIREPIEVGNIFHRAAELFYTGQSASLDSAQRLAVLESQEQLFPKNRGPAIYQPGYQQWLALRDLSWSVLQGYDLWRQATGYYGDHKLAYHQDLGEYEWEVRLNSEFTIGGKIDLLAKHIPTGEYWIIEHKTTGNPDELISGLNLSWQPRIYTWAARQLWPDLNIAGVLYNIVTRSDPYDIKKLKDGLPSRAKTELGKTTYEIYKGEIEHWLEAHPNEQPGSVWESYADQLQALKSKQYPLYLRHPHRVRLSKRFGALLADIAYEVSKVVYLTDAPQAIPSLSPHPRYGHCQHCPFVGPCQLMDSDGDYQALLDAGYNRKGEVNAKD